MTPSNLFLLINSLVFYSIIDKSQQCNVEVIEPGEILISQRMNILLIESDTQDFETKNYTNYNIINESIRISSFVNELVISTQIIEYFGFRSIQDQLFCKFIKTDTYFISCIKVINYYANDRLNYLNDQSIISIELNDLNGSMCEEFFINSQQEFLIFCFQNFHMNIYQVDQENNISLKIQYKINQYQYEMCKRKYFKLDDNYYLISFFECDNWGLYYFWQQEIKEVLKEKITNSVDTIYLENIQICQNRFQLIFQSGYQQFYFDNQKRAIFEIHFLFSLHFKDILFTQTCFAQCYIQYNQSINQTIILHNNKKYLYQFEGTYLQIQLLMNILFIFTQNQLQVIYNQDYQQIIKLNTSQIVFNDRYNLIYWLDETTKEIIFYKFSYPKNFIVPTKKYIFYIESFSFIQKEMLSCIEIRQEQQNTNKYLYFNSNYNCQNSSYFLYRKRGLQLPLEYKIKHNESLEFKINIEDEQPFIFFCPKLQNLNKQDTTLLFYETNTTQSFSIIQSKNYIYFQNCDGVNKFKVYVQECQVFYFQSSLLLYYQDKKKLKFIRFQDQSIIEYKIESQIINIIQFEQIIILFTSNSKDLKLINLSTRSYIILSSKINQILYRLHNKYLQNNQTYQNQTFQSFYYTPSKSNFVQYLQYLIVEIHSQIRLFQLENIQIVFFKQMLSQQYYILGVHFLNNQIIDYYFDYEQISKLFSINLDDYELIKPLKYQINEKYFVIACRNQTKTFVLIFEIIIAKPLQLIKVIQISRIQFFFQEYQLFYYDLEDEIKIYNMHDFQIEIQYPITKLRESVTNISTEVTFQIISANKNDPVINLGFTLRSFNECYQLFQKSNHFYIYSTQQNISITNYFFGPIESLKIEDTKGTNINGPLLLYQEILHNNHTDGIRIKIINITPSFQNTSLSLIFYQNDFEQAFILNQENIQFEYIIPINEQSVLILYTFNNNYSIKGIIYQIDEYTSKQESIFEINLILNQSHDQYQIFKTGDLIIFKSQSHLLLYMIIDSSIKFIENDLNIVEILKIQGNNQFYICLTQVNLQKDYQFHVLSLTESQLISIRTAILEIQTILNELQNYILKAEMENLIYYHKFYFLECNIDDQGVRILILQILTQVSIISQIHINIENHQISFRAQKILRLWLEQVNMILKFYNKNNLILKSSSDSIYFYDLQEELQLYDYIGKFNLNQYSYFPLNTTHLIIFQRSTNQIFIGQIGYRLDKKNQNLENETFTLIAENQVSQARCNITIIDINDQQEDNMYLSKLLILLGLILVSYFLFRRMQLKSKQKHSKILTNISKVEQ